MESSELERKIFSFSTDMADEREEFIVEIFDSLSLNSIYKDSGLPVTTTKNFEELLRFIDSLEEN